MTKRPLTLMVAVFLILSIACTSEASPNPQATIDAAVEATIAALPPQTATPILDPTTPTVLAMGEPLPLQSLRGKPPISQNLEMTVSNPQWIKQELSVDVAVNNTGTTKISLLSTDRIGDYYIKARDAAGNSGTGGPKDVWRPYNSTSTLWPETKVQRMFSWEFGPASQNIQIIVYKSGGLRSGKPPLPIAIWEVNGTTQ